MVAMLSIPHLLGCDISAPPRLLAQAWQISFPSGYPWHSAAAAWKLVLVGALAIFSLLQTLLRVPFYFAL